MKAKAEKYDSQESANVQLVEKLKAENDALKDETQAQAGKHAELLDNEPNTVSGISSADSNNQI